MKKPLTWVCNLLILQAIRAMVHLNFGKDGTMKTFGLKLIGISGLLFALNVGVYGQSIYNNTTTDTGNSLTLVNGETLGDEIVMGNSSPFDSVTGISFELYSVESAFVSEDVQMEVYLLQNNGTPFNGYATPNTVLYDSGLFSLETPQQFAGSNVGTVDDTFSSPVTVPQDFTLAVEVTGLSGSDSLGIELFDPPTVGSNYGDYWLNTGSWGLYTNSVPTAFGAQVEGTASPEPSVGILGVLGFGLTSLALYIRRRV
jgi:hypothetical protein